MVNPFRMLLALAASLVFAIGFVHPRLTSAAFAAGPSAAANPLNSMASMQAILEEVTVTDGAFSVKTSTTIPALPKPLRIGQAIVSLSPDSMKEGTVSEIKITGPKGIEFGCKNLKVKPNTDLIKACGGPAILEAGATTYEASGVNFGPEQSGTFSISLIP